MNKHTFGAVLAKCLLEMSIVQPSEIKAKMPTYPVTKADTARREYLSKRQNVQQREIIKNTMR